jgi:phenylalanine-4-hydroxylase
MQEAEARARLGNISSNFPLRGDYASARKDFSIDQDYGLYTADEQNRWRQLYARQEKLIATHAAPEFMRGIKIMNTPDKIPSLPDVSTRLAATTGWRLVGVPGLIPNADFFGFLAQRVFPVTCWLRTPVEMDYLVEPDIFHDFFGHVPLLFNQTFADYLAAYGTKGQQTRDDEQIRMLARLYWYTVEFGLIKTTHGLRAFGSGIVSSYGETRYCLEDPKPLRVGFNLARVLQTDYRIDDYQQTYFVIHGYNELFGVMQQNFDPFYKKFSGQQLILPTQTMPDDELFEPVAPL